jgi:ATP-dependent exoDNAse (exonuclease V) beta subunit
MYDSAERANALDPRHSFIVQAPAGSGKTELLTQRYLRLLSQVDQPEQIVAITFTRKAAAEMRQRVLAALAQDLTQRPDLPHQQTTWDLAQAVRVQDEAQAWLLMQSPNRLRIQTFDSLAAELTRQLPVLSELGAQPKVTEQALPWYQQAAQATLASLTDADLGPHLAPVLAHLDNRLGQLEDLLCSMLQRRDQWLPTLFNMPDVAKLEEALQSEIERKLTQLDGLFSDQLLTEAVHLANYAAAQLPTEHPLAVWSDHPDCPLTRWEDLPLWRGLATLLLTTKCELRKKVDKRIGFPAASDKGLTAEEKHTRKANKAAILGLLAELHNHPSLIESLALVPALPVQGYSPEQYALLGHLQIVLLQAAAQLQVVFQETGQVDFTELQQRAIQALGSDIAPTDLALALDHQLQHILVDEFQDTSSNQYQLLCLLTAGWQPGDGRSVFLVGDPMQSIYRFREAEVGLYLQTRDQGLGDIALIPLSLQMNFRSKAGVVDWVNTCFQILFPKQADITLGAVCYAPSQAAQTASSEPAVHWHPQAGRNDADEAQRICTLVNHIQEQQPTASIALLARGRAHLTEIAATLDAMQIPYQAININPLGRRPVVQDLRSLTRAILHPADRLAWLALLRAPWLGLSLADLLLIAEDSTRLIYAALCDPVVQQRLSIEGRTRVLRLLSLLQPILPWRGRLALRSALEGLWLALGGLALAGAAGEADAQAYFALLDQLDQPHGLLDFTLLDAQLLRLYAAPSSQADGRLQLLTMHAAKGLEFDVVILPGLGRKPRQAQQELLYWQERPEAGGGNTLLMAPIRATYTDDEPIADFIRHIHQQKNQLEVVRLLYVAATRARQQLHLFGHCDFDVKDRPKAPAHSLLHYLWPIAESHFADMAMMKLGESSEPLREASAESRLAADWSLPQNFPAITSAKSFQAPILEHTWVDDTARHIGTLVHRYLERIANQGLSAWSTNRLASLRSAFGIALTHLGVAATALPDAIEKVYRALANTLDDTQGRWILSPHTAAQSEWALTYQQAQTHHYIVDRTFLDEQGTRWIIDYKTAEPENIPIETFLDQQQATYQEQLMGYAELLQHLENNPIQLALYFPLCKGWRAWRFCDER